MFSNDTHCVYTNNPLADVICQLRFPEILTIGANVPVDFQEEIRGEFPQYSARNEVLPPQPGQPQRTTVNYQFVSADGIWRVNLTSKFISLACSRYTCWEDFAAHLDKPLAAFIRIYKPAYFERVGLRYLNFISRRDLGLEGVPFRELIAPCYLGPLSLPHMQESAALRNTVDTELRIRGGCLVKIHAGPGLIRRKGSVQDKELKFIFDQDLYMPGKVPVSLSAGALQTLHSQSFAIFHGAITDTLHDAMEPKYQ